MAVINTNYGTKLNEFHGPVKDNIQAINTEQEAIKSGSIAAGKANKDGSGNIIHNTYATKNELAQEAAARQEEDQILQGQINDIGNGVTTVGKAQAAVNDGIGNNIASTYASKNSVQQVQQQIDQLTDKAPVPNFSDLTTTYPDSEIGWHVFVEGVNNPKERGWYTFMSGINQISNGVDNGNWSVTGTGSTVNPTSIKVVSSPSVDGTAILPTSLAANTEYRMEYKVFSKNILSGSLYIDTTILNAILALDTVVGTHEITFTTKESISTNQLKLILSNGGITDADVTFQVISVIRTDSIEWQVDTGLTPLASSTNNGLLSKEDFVEVKKIPGLEITLNEHLESNEAHTSSEIVNESSVIGGKVTQALDTLKGEIESIVLGDANATIGVYSVSDTTNTNDYTASIGGVVEYFGGFKINLTVGNVNTGAATITINELEPKSIKIKKEDGTKVDVSAGNIYGLVQLEYDGTDFILIGESVPANYTGTADIFPHALPANCQKGQLNAEINGVTLNNPTVNPDFENDFTGWGYNSPTIVTTGGLYGNKCLRTSSGVQSFAQQDIPFPNGHKIYCVASAYVENYSSGVNCMLQVLDYNSYNYNYEALVDMSKINSWQKVSLIRTSANGGVRLLLGRPGIATENTRFDGVMTIDLTALGLDTLTVAECDARFNFIKGVKSTLSVAITSTLNLFDKNSEYEPRVPGITSTPLPTGIKVKTTVIYGYVAYKKNLKPNTIYSINFNKTVITGNASQVYVMDDAIQNDLGHDTKGFSFTTPSNGKIAILFYCSIDAAIGEVDFTEITLNEGSTAILYTEPSTVYTPNNIILRDIKDANGVVVRKDVFNVLTGEHTSNVGYDVLDANAEWVHDGTLTNTYRFYANALTYAAKDAVGQMWLNGQSFPYVSEYTNDSEHFSFLNGVNRLWLFIAKSKIDTMSGASVLDKFKAYLSQYTNPIAVSYQLNTSIVKQVKQPQNLMAYSGGVILQRHIFNDYDFYDEANGIRIANTTLPIKRLDRVTWVDKATGVEVDITDTCTLHIDNLGFDSTYAIDGDLLDFDCEYDSSLGTLGTVTYSVAINTKQQIIDTIDGMDRLGKKVDNVYVRLQAQQQEIESIKAACIKGEVETSDGNPTVLVSLRLEKSKVYTFKALVVGKLFMSPPTVPCKGGGYEVKCVVSVAGNGNTSFIGTPEIITIATNKIEWVVAAEVTNDFLNIKVTGNDGEITRWACNLEWAEVY